MILNNNTENVESSTCRFNLETVNVLELNNFFTLFILVYLMSDSSSPNFRCDKINHLSLLAISYAKAWDMCLVVLLSCWVRMINLVEQFLEYSQHKTSILIFFNAIEEFHTHLLRWVKLFLSNLSTHQGVCLAWVSLTTCEDTNDITKESSLDKVIEVT
jgi:hypothetical protein